jgi:hypothetical protein
MTNPLRVEPNTSSCGSGRLTRALSPSPNNYYPH